MDLFGQTCFAAAEKCEVKGKENQHPDMKVMGFVTALSGQVLLLSRSKEALSEFSLALQQFR